MEKENNKKHSNIWNQKELSVINDLSLSNREVANLLGKKYFTIIEQRKNLNITGHKKDINLWTKEDLKILAENSDKNSTQLAEILNRTPKAIHLKRTKLGLKLESIEWKPEEIKYLTQQYYNLPIEDIEKFLGRTASAIRSQARLLGIVKRNAKQHSNAWNEKELSIINDLSLSNKEVADILDKEYSNVTQKRRRLNITEHKKEIDIWSEEEDEILRQNKNKSNKQLAKIINRTENAICNRKMKLKIAKKNKLRPR